MSIVNPQAQLELDSSSVSVAIPSIFLFGVMGVAQSGAHYVQ